MVVELHEFEGAKDSEIASERHYSHGGPIVERDLSISRDRAGRRI
jgi:hypothetical protein